MDTKTKMKSIKGCLGSVNRAGRTATPSLIWIERSHLRWSTYGSAIGSTRIKYCMGTFSKDCTRITRACDQSKGHHPDLDKQLSRGGNGYLNGILEMNKAEAADFHIYMKKDCWEQQYLFDQTLTLSPQNVVSQVHRALHAVRLDFI